MRATTVVNLKGHRGDPAFDDVVYVGRAMHRGGWQLPASPLASLFRPGPDGSREEVVASYREYLLGRADLLALLPELRGRRLGCWCAPQPCHAAVIAELADAGAGRAGASRAASAPRPPAVTEPSFLRSTRAAYDIVAADYAERFSAELAAKPLDRALLAGFAELVRALDAGPVADIGCGPGHVTAHLHALGLAAFGVDLSPQMVALARLAHPGLRFDEGSMTALDLPDGALGGIAALYSIIHIPPERLPGVFAEFHRVLAPGGHLLLAFQVGDERRHLSEAFGRAVSVDAYRLPPDRVAELLGEAGLVMRAQLLREPDGAVEQDQRAYLLARKPPPSPGAERARRGSAARRR